MLLIVARIYSRFYCKRRRTDWHVTCKHRDMLHLRTLAVLASITLAACSSAQQPDDRAQVESDLSIGGFVSCETMPKTLKQKGGPYLQKLKLLLQEWNIPLEAEAILLWSPDHKYIQILLGGDAATLLTEKFFNEAFEVTTLFAFTWSLKGGEVGKMTKSVIASKSGASKGPFEGGGYLIVKSDKDDEVGETGVWGTFTAGHFAAGFCKGGIIGTAETGEINGALSKFYNWISGSGSETAPTGGLDQACTSGWTSYYCQDNLVCERSTLTCTEPTPAPEEPAPDVQVPTP
jgi:hypothetical protein